MRVGVLLAQALRGFLEFLDCLIPQVCQLLLGRLALVRRRFLQIDLCLFLLVNERVARSEVRLQPFEFALSLLGLFHLLLSRGALLGNDLLEIDIDFRVLAALHSALDLVRRLFVIRWRENNEYGVNAGAQVGHAEFAGAIRLGLLLCALVAYRANANLGPGLPTHIQDCAANRAGLGRSTRCKHACQRGHQDGGKRPRLKKSLHAPFSFFTGSPARSVQAMCAPLSLSSAPIPSSAPGGYGSTIGDGIWRAGFHEGA